MKKEYIKLEVNIEEVTGVDVIVTSETLDEEQVSGGGKIVN